MRAHTIGLTFALLTTIAPAASSAVRWHHENAVYFDVWDKGKAQCQATYAQAIAEAQRLPTNGERRDASGVAKAQRKTCRQQAKRDAHEAYLRARKERGDAIRAARRAKKDSTALRLMRRAHELRTE